MNLLRQTIGSVFILAIFSGALLSIDLQRSYPDQGEWLLGSLLESVFSGGKITTTVLKQTSHPSTTISASSSTKSFFEGYLQLPNGISAKRYSIEDPKITITEVKNPNPTEIIRAMTENSRSDFSLNIINEGTFFLNQQPLEQKTHNFLGIIIDQTLFGFQYEPKDHAFLLEIIDALEQNK